MTFTATVTGQPGFYQSLPTGTVSFLDGTTSLGSSALNSDGLATLTISTLAVATHSVTATYSGATDFAPSTSAVLSQVVAGFGVSATPGNATLNAGSSAVFTLTASAMYGFNGPVSLTCSVSPAPALAPTCALNPTSVTPTSSGSVTSQLSVATTGPTASLVRPILPHNSSRLYSMWLPLCGLTLLGVGASTRRSKRITIFLGVLIALLMLVLWTACGGASNRSNNSGHTGTPPGQYTVTVNATSGSITRSTAVTITVQ
ncbi:MAG: Ig-like domain-containing protein [Acidobacteriota bacterium]